MQHYYKSQAPDVVAIVQDFYEAKAQLDEQLAKLGEVMGGKVASMRDVTSLFAGGVKLPADRTLDVHWRKPDEHGFRSLRTAAVPPKGIAKEEREAIRTEHSRLITLWREHCPERLDTHIYWERLNVNTGNLMLCGGIKFDHQGVAYFCLGFEINEAQHLANVDAGTASAGWITGAVEILPSEYEAARKAKLGVTE